MEKVIVIGAGIVGCTLARGYAEKGYEVEIVERRDHIAGNLFDYVDEYGILVHQYGPHIFHTSNDEIYDFICKYAAWSKYKLVCGAIIDGICTPTAFNYRTIDQFYSKQDAAEIKEHIKLKFGTRESATVIELLSCDDALIRNYAQFLFDKDYSLYTAKQWGVDPSEIDKSVLQRVPIRFTYEEAYFKDKYECLPIGGYSAFIKSIIDHPQINITLNKDGKNHISFDNNIVLWDGKKELIIYTGAVDELFDCCFGRLPYRSLRFEWKHEDTNSFQEMPVVAYPQANGFTRITEYKKLPVQNVTGTSYAVEYPLPYKEDSAMEPYYPVLTGESQELYEKYRDKAASISNLMLCGRLAEFKYYNMDQAIARALLLLSKN